MHQPGQCSDFVWFCKSVEHCGLSLLRFFVCMCVLSPIKSTCNIVMFLDISPYIFIISYILFVSSPAKLCVILIIHNNFHVLFVSFSLPCFFPFQIWFWKDGNFLLLFACLSLNLFVLLFTPGYLISALVLWNSTQVLLLFLLNCILGAYFNTRMGNFL